ncbi:MAG: TIGR04283 family arsenosugar biosynthesis glycosyltransferase [Desulfamplus sp.]|nr:TIGR04283 family arsenosugar biosynthesis glycosyltransferase [Desulfamplus sp.]
MFSFIIPVLYEGSSINICISKLCQQFSDHLFEIIVVDGDSEKSTIKHIKPTFLSSYPKIKLATSQPGRGIQMNRGAELADGEILIFLHADTKLPSDALTHIVRAINIDQYKAGAFKLRFDSQRKIYRLIEFFASLRCRLTHIPYGDQAIFISKSYFQKIGNFSEIPIMEDIDIMLRIRRLKDRVFISDKWVQTSARRWEKEGVLYCSLRSFILALLFRIGISPYRLLKYYKIFF